MPKDLAQAALMACCGSAIWARRLADARPFESVEAVQAESERVWWDLAQEDWRLAFATHPRIGENKSANASEQSQAWSEKEQSGARGAAAETMTQLAEGNAKYERRFGYIYIVCATGKTADEMLALLRQRLQNDPAAEIRIAAAEQAQITRLRVEKFLGAA